MPAVNSNVVFTTLAILCFSATGTHSLLYWNEAQPTSTLKPSPRQYGGLAWTSAALYLFGGQTSDGAADDTWKFSLNTYTWEQLSLTTKPSARYGFVSGVLNDYWYIIQGRSDDAVHSDVWAFDLLTQEWLLVNITTSGAPVPRYFAAGGSNTAIISSDDATGAIWISMGIDSADRKLSDLWTFNVNFSIPLEGKWIKLSEGVNLNQYNPNLPHARSNVAGMPFANGQFVITGGCANGGHVGGPCPLEDSWIYSSSKNTWTRLSSCSIPTHSASLIPFSKQYPDIGLLYGGTQNGPGLMNQIVYGTAGKSDEISLLNITSLKWIKVKLFDSVPSLRGGAQISLGAAGVFMFGGKDFANGTLLNDLWVLQGTSSNITLVSCSSTWFTFLHLHGILMYIAWGILLPFGVLIARYLKLKKTKSMWLVTHIVCQIGGFLFTCSGFIIVFLVSSRPSFSHGVIGIGLMFIILQQLLSGLIRPWKLKKANRGINQVNAESFTYKWKQCWEVYHRVSGIVAVGIGFIQVTLGVFLLDAPPIVWGVWLGLLSLWLLLFVALEIAYQYCIRSSKH